MSMSAFRRFSFRAIKGVKYSTHRVKKLQTPVATTRITKPWTLKDFSNPNFTRLSTSEAIEEETVAGYVAEQYYPVRIGDLISSRYQIVGKLGFGITSTVWLARDLTDSRHVALKIYIQSSSLGTAIEHELSAYRRLEEGPRDHPGRRAVRKLHDSFVISGPHGKHQCLVHPPLWEDAGTFLNRNPPRRFPTDIIAYLLRQLFQALDYAHQCRVIHTDISPRNIMLGVIDDTIFKQFEKAELNSPSPRKELDDGRIIYVSRPLEMPETPGLPVLCDFGSAVWGEERHTGNVQPKLYRSPEVILGVPWGYEIDIWNVGCLIWDLFEGGHLFDARDPEHDAYRTRAHLCEMITLMGPPPPEFLTRSTLRSKFFTEQGEFINAGLEVLPRMSLAEVETALEAENDVEDRELFLKFLGKMFQWDTRHRATAKELLADRWLKNNTTVRYHRKKQRSA